jgi:hypothetical protein
MAGEFNDLAFRYSQLAQKDPQYRWNLRLGDMSTNVNNNLEMLQTAIRYERQYGNTGALEGYLATDVITDKLDFKYALIETVEQVLEARKVGILHPVDRSANDHNTEV